MYNIFVQSEMNKKLYTVAEFMSTKFGSTKKRGHRVKPQQMPTNTEYDATRFAAQQLLSTAIQEANAAPALEILRKTQIIQQRNKFIHQNKDEMLFRRRLKKLLLSIFNLHKNLSILYLFSDTMSEELTDDSLSLIKMGKMVRISQSNVV